MATQDYTLTAAAPTQPTSASYALEVDDPLLQMSGLSARESITVRVSADGSDPAASDVAFVVRRHDCVGGSYKQKLQLKTGNKIVFVGSNLDGDSSISIQIENS